MTMPSFSARSHLLFDLADRGQVLVELAAVGAAERATCSLLRVSPSTSSRMLWRIASAARVRGGRFHDVGAEEPLEQIARIGDRRQRLRLGLPRDVVGVGARVAVVAVAGLARFFEADFERGQLGLVADRVGGDLIGGDAELADRRPRCW